MNWLQSLLESRSIPIFTAFLLGLLTTLSPCPLATNIAAIGYIGKSIDDRKRIFCNGLLYTLGRVVAYTLLGVVLIAMLKGGSSLFGIQKFIGKYGELFFPPALLIIGLYTLFGSKLQLPSFGFNCNGEGLIKHGGWGAFLLGVLFALVFCPTSGVFYFGILIPMSATSVMGYLLPIIFAIATALPVLIVAWVLTFSVRQIGKVYGRMQTIQRWLNIAVGILSILIGIYYCVTIYF
ncbi:MAG: aromatic aminobenezylarsenical efflux permease ArsG family transporter [Prevotella sp.]|nr:aromatic aminobenezylarsenical efflux permease ArsG family transporter [Prevotella sp.]MDY4218109.1 aromatic aminobenezylarsenical efflux permease ArsG family transporter [Prevotella sp.]